MRRYYLCKKGSLSIRSGLLLGAQYIAHIERLFSTLSNELAFKQLDMTKNLLEDVYFLRNLIERIVLTRRIRSRSDRSQAGQQVETQSTMKTALMEQARYFTVPGEHL